MIRRSKGHAVVEVMNVDREIRMALVKLVDALAFHNDDEIDLDKVKAQLLEEKSKSLRFGSILSRLHDALLNDPKPYRKNVKDFQVNLFNWLKYLELPDFEFSKYNVSETISLTND